MSEFFLDSVTLTNASDVAHVGGTDTFFGAQQGSQIYIDGYTIPDTSTRAISPLTIADAHA